MLTGGDGDDQMFGQARQRSHDLESRATTATSWKAATATTSAEVNGGNGAEQFTATANGTRVRFDRIDPAPFAIDIGTTETHRGEHERRR